MAVSWVSPERWDMTTVHPARWAVATVARVSVRVPLGAPQGQTVCCDVILSPSRTVPASSTSK